MARTIYEGFSYYSGPRLTKVKVRARDGKTWKKGCPMVIDSGLWEPIATDGTRVGAIASQDQTSATSSSDVYVERILSSETKFLGYASSDANDAAVTRASIGEDYGIQMDTYYPSVNTNETSNVAVIVDNPLWVKEPYMNDSTDSPAKVIFHFEQSALE